MTKLPAMTSQRWYKGRCIYRDTNGFWWYPEFNGHGPVAWHKFTSLRAAKNYVGCKGLTPTLLVAYDDSFPLCSPSLSSSV